ncbi:MAG TPA: hypothetical protein VKU77_31680 [Streptosporangiaceae bacterium]|nr:hypothetical protein [Streptosporangiaceae bacterium]
MDQQAPAFSLRALCREVWDDLGGCDYHVLAKEAERRITAQDAALALPEALTEYARMFAMGQRPPLSKQKPGAGQRNSARSWKVQGARQMWPQLKAHIFTSDGQKALGKCTAADLIFHADLLEKQSRHLVRKASRERELAAALKAHKAERVENLPDDVLAEFFGGEENAA